MIIILDEDIFLINNIWDISTAVLFSKWRMYYVITPGDNVKVVPQFFPQKTLVYNIFINGSELCLRKKHRVDVKNRGIRWFFGYIVNTCIVSHHQAFSADLGCRFFPEILGSKMLVFVVLSHASHLNIGRQAKVGRPNTIH